MFGFEQPQYPSDKPRFTVTLPVNSIVYPQCNAGQNRSQTMYRVLDEFVTDSYNLTILPPHGFESGRDPFKPHVYGFDVMNVDKLFSNWCTESPFYGYLAPVNIFQGLVASSNDTTQAAFCEAFDKAKVGCAGSNVDNLSLTKQDGYDQDKHKFDSAASLNTYMEKVRNAFKWFTDSYWKVVSNRPCIFVCFARSFEITLMRLLESNEGRLDNVCVLALNWDDYAANPKPNTSCKSMFLYMHETYKHLWDVSQLETYKTRRLSSVQQAKTQLGLLGYKLKPDAQQELEQFVLRGGTIDGVSASPSGSDATRAPRRDAYSLESMPDHQIKLLPDTILYPMCHSGQNRSQVMYHVLNKIATQFSGLEVKRPHIAYRGFDFTYFYKNGYDKPDNASVYDQWFTLQPNLVVEVFDPNAGDVLETSFFDAFKVRKQQRILEPDVSQVRQWGQNLESATTLVDRKAIVESAKSWHETFTKTYWKLGSLDKHHVFVCFYDSPLVCLHRLLESNHSTFSNVTIVALRWPDVLKDESQLVQTYLAMQKQYTSLWDLSNLSLIQRARDTNVGGAKEGGVEKGGGGEGGKPSDILRVMDVKQVNVSPLVRFMFERYTRMYIQAYKTGASLKKQPTIIFTNGEPAVQTTQICVKIDPSLEERAKTVHQLCRGAIMTNMRVVESTFGAFYRTYFGNDGMVPKLLRGYYTTASYVPPQLDDVAWNEMFGTLVVAWANSPLGYPEPEEGTIDNAGAGKCGYIAVMLSLLINDQLETIVTKMLSMLKKLVQTSSQEEALNNTIKELEDQVGAKTSEIADIQAKMQETKRLDTEANALRSQQQAKVGAKFATKNIMLRQIEDVQAQLKYHQAQHNDAKVILAQQQIDELQSSLTLLDSEITNLTRQVNGMGEKLDKNNEVIGNYSESIRKAKIVAQNLREALLQAKARLRIIGLISTRLQRILGTQSKTPSDYRTELLKCYKLDNKNVTPINLPFLCVRLMMAFMYRGSPDILEKFNGRELPDQQLQPDGLATWSTDLGVCSVLTVPDYYTNTNTFFAEPARLDAWWQRYYENNTFVWIESVGREVNGRYEGGHYVTHDYKAKIEAFGKKL